MIARKFNANVRARGERSARRRPGERHIVADETIVLKQAVTDAHSMRNRPRPSRFGMARSVEAGGLWMAEIVTDHAIVGGLVTVATPRVGQCWPRRISIIGLEPPMHSPLKNPTPRGELPAGPLRIAV